MWLRIRFKTSHSDPRPTKWLPPGPYWLSGYDDKGRHILIAYVKKMSQIKEYWPECYEVEDAFKEKEILYTDRFPKPEWWVE